MPPAPAILDDGTRLNLTEARRAHVVERFPVLALLNMIATALWLASLVWTGDVSVRAALATVGAQLAILVPAVLVCRARSAAMLVLPIAVAACALVGISWIALFAVTGASGIILGFVVFVIFAAAGIGMAWGLGPQLALQGSVTLVWVLVLPLLMKRLAFSERFAVAGVGSVIALVIAAWAARMFRDEQQRRFEERRLSNELRASRDRFRDIYENARDFIWMADLKGRLTYVNDALARLHDRPASEIVGQTIADLLTDHPANPPRVDWRPGVARVRAGERLASMIVHAKSASGPRWMETVISPVRDAHGQVIGLQATSRDVTERREAEEALRESEARYRRLVDELRASEEKLRFLAQRQVTVREEERKRLGFDLHDDVCQELVGIGILVESSRARLESGHGAAHDLERVSHYLSEVVEHVRLLARELRPMLLHDLGLEDSLQSLATGLATAETSVRATFPTRVPRLEEGAELAVYRIAQEALTNASRHAAAKTIVLTLSTDEQTLKLEVRDDGLGFDPGDRRGQALGLVSMQERALALGGRLEVQSAPGEGTTVRLVCPLAERSPASAA